MEYNLIVIYDANSKREFNQIVNFNSLQIIFKLKYWVLNIYLESYMIEDVYVFIYLANEIFLQILKYSSIIYYIISIISQWMRIKSSKKFSNIFKTKPFARCLWTCLTFLFWERWKSGVKIQSSKEIKCREYFLQVVSSYNKRKQSITYLLTLFWLIS